MASNVNFYRKDLFGYGVTYHVPVPDDGKIAVDMHLRIAYFWKKIRLGKDSESFFCVINYWKSVENYGRC